MGIKAVKREAASILTDLDRLGVKFEYIFGKAKTKEEKALLDMAKKTSTGKRAAMFMNRQRMYSLEIEKIKQVDCVVIIDDAARSKVEDAGTLMKKVIDTFGRAKVSMTAYSNGKMCLVAMREKTEESDE